MSNSALAITFATVILAGCVAPGITQSEPASDAGTADVVVIALIDSGLTPYSGTFDVEDDARFERAIGMPFTNVVFPPRNGSEDPVGRDAALWESLRPNEVYHFDGTRLFGLSLDPERTTAYNLDVVRHGVGTSDLAGREAPQAAILMIQVGDNGCYPPVSCVIPPNIATAMEWVADQDWIDVVSVSLVFPANAPDRSEAHPDMARYLVASREAASSGKLVLNGAGNFVTPPLTGYFNGPPHVIAVGGYEFNASGESAPASKGIDVVSNFSEWVPGDGNGEFREGSGTSFATPIVAGTLATALAIIREAQPGRNITTQEIRDALNASALMFEPTSWRPTLPSQDPSTCLSGYCPILGHFSVPAATQAQMGWGYVNGSLAPEIARRVLDGDYAIPAGKEQAAAFQPAWQRAREEYWATYE